MLIPHKGHTDTIQVYSVTVMTHVKALQAGHSSQGTSEPITGRQCLPSQCPQNWKVCYDVFWGRCRHRSPFRQLSLGDLAAGHTSGNSGPGPTDATEPHMSELGYDSCFSCGKAGHGVGRCHELNETFPFMLPGWSAEKVGSSYVMISLRVAAERRPDQLWNSTPGPRGGRVQLTSSRDVAVTRPVNQPTLWSGEPRSGEVRVSNISVYVDRKRVNQTISSVPAGTDVLVSHGDSERQLKSGLPLRGGGGGCSRCGCWCLCGRKAGLCVPKEY